MTFEKVFQAEETFSVLDLHSSNCSAVSVRRAVEVLPAGHASRSGRRSPPNEGISMKSLQVSCGTQQCFTSHIFRLSEVALLDLQSNSKIAALLPYFVYVISGVCFVGD